MTTIAAWLAGWTAFVLVMAGVLSTQKYVPFQYALRSEGIHYYTLAAVSLIVWFAAGAITTREWRMALPS